METQRNWEQKVNNCELELSDSLNTYILVAMGIPLDSAEDVLLNLQKNEVAIWFELATIETEEELVQIAGKDKTFGTTLWRAINRYKDKHKEIRRIRSKPPVKKSAFEIVLDILEDVKLPSTVDAFEFPKFSLAINNANHKAVEDGDIRASFKNRNQPDFLLTGLDKSFSKPMSLMPCSEHEEEGLQISSGPSQIDPNDFGRYRSVVLVSPSAGGRTRFLYEQAYKSFGCLFDASGKGSADLSSFTKSLHFDPSETRQEHSYKVVTSMHTLIAIRCIVLSNLCRRIKGFEPRHWLAVQMFPKETLRTDVFDDAFRALQDAHVEFPMSDASQMFFSSEMKFLSIDDAQVIDDLYKGYFTNSGGMPCSLLKVVADALINADTGFIFSSTRANVVSAVDVWEPDVYSLNSFGIFTTFTKDDVERAVRASGYSQDSVDPYYLELFAGRPGFAMRLAHALLMKRDVDVLVEEITEECKERFKELHGKPIHGSILFKSRPDRLTVCLNGVEEWCLRGKGSGENDHDGVVFETEMCPSKNIASYNRHAFLTEPFVVKALYEMGNKNTFKEMVVDDECPTKIQTKLENYLGRNAQVLVNGVHAFLKIAAILEEDGSRFYSFHGPWQVIPPKGNMRRGIEITKPGDEVRVFNEIMESSSQGLSLVFPSALFGANMVIFANHLHCPKRTLVLLIRTVLESNMSAEKAMNMLRLPYHENRDSECPSVDPSLQSSLKEYEAFLARPDICVMFIVIKYPGKIAKKYPRLQTKDLVIPFLSSTSTKGSPNKKICLRNTINVVEIVIDNSNAERWMPNMKDSFDALKRVPTLEEWRSLFTRPIEKRTDYGIKTRLRSSQASEGRV